VYDKLKLQINEAKSAVCSVFGRKFLGNTLWVAKGREVKCKVAHKALEARGYRRHDERNKARWALRPGDRNRRMPSGTYGGVGDGGGNPSSYPILFVMDSRGPRQRVASAGTACRASLQFVTRTGRRVAPAPRAPKRLRTVGPNDKTRP